MFILSKGILHAKLLFTKFAAYLIASAEGALVLMFINTKLAISHLLSINDQL
ncbi:MAG: hypothetical protein Q8S84_08440 [bacterium]|nr:hypothetical protein [bacterium]MDP3381463.1 hypothetical protein [bacterium]